MALTREERQQLLSEPHVAAVGVARGDGRAPLVVPVWYMYSSNGGVMLVTERDSVKAALIAKAGRFSLMVDRVTPTLRYVSVEGPVVEVAPAGDGDIYSIIARYAPPDRVAWWVDYTETQLGEHVVITMRPERSYAADLGPV